MANHSYNLNLANAEKIGGIGRINTTGAYDGQFTRAEAVESDKGTLGIEFDFKSEDGASAQFLQIWTMNAKGEELPGRKIIDAMMLVMRVRDMAPKAVMVEKYSSQSKQVEKMKANCFIELMGKSIGALLQKEIGTYNGQPKERMQIYGVYDVASRKTPREIVKKLPAGTLDGIIAGLKDRIEKGSHAPATGATGGGIPANHPANEYVPDMDDIQF